LRALEGLENQAQEWAFIQFSLSSFWIFIQEEPSSSIFWMIFTCHPPFQQTINWRLDINYKGWTCHQLQRINMPLWVDKWLIHIQDLVIGQKPILLKSCSPIGHELNLSHGNPWVLIVCDYNSSNF
jgi:hypothetical protein